MLFFGRILRVFFRIYKRRPKAYCRGAAFSNIGQVRAELFSSRFTQFCITIYIVKTFILLGEIL
jgi:hypothetical protein